MGELVRVETGGLVATVTLDRPAARNALSAALLDQLTAAFDALRDDPGVRAVVLTGADPAFCAGVDLKEVAAGPRRPFSSAPIDAITEAGKPVIGAVNGPAVTGGLELALACDLRIASERARFADTHARVGVAPAWGMSWRLPHAVGYAWARQMSFTGNYVDAELALRLGLVNEVVPHERLLPRALELAGDMATVDPADLAVLREMYARCEQGTAAEAATH
ncbi:MAG TPA: enoyl-CoA hydratase, partial [Frankiaceae bacterium]|nr:enoyl-CoA hydratase [Frankiaceae bacterium]